MGSISWHWQEDSTGSNPLGQCTTAAPAVLESSPKATDVHYPQHTVDTMKTFKTLVCNKTYQVNSLNAGSSLLLNQCRQSQPNPELQQLHVVV